MDTFRMDTVSILNIPPNLHIDTTQIPAITTKKEFDDEVFRQSQIMIAQVLDYIAEDPYDAHCRELAKRNPQATPPSLQEYRKKHHPDFPADSAMGYYHFIEEFVRNALAPLTQISAT